MNFALLGADDESLALVAAAIAAGNELTWQGDLADLPSPAGTALGSQDRGEDWEDLFDPSLADGVIVGRGSASAEMRARQIQELVKQGRPLLVVFPLFDSVLTFFEVDMARGESGAVLQHYNPLVDQRVTSDLRKLICNDHPGLGRVQQVQAVRTLVDRSQPAVLRRFARDVDFLEMIAGPINRLGAHAAADAQAAYETLSVQLQGPAGLPIRWSVEPPSRREELRVTLICEHGRVTATFDAFDRPAENELVPHDLTVAGRETENDSASAAIEKFAKAVSSQRNGSAHSTWPAALHAMELTDSIEISLRRGRMIDIHAQQLTEQLAFKGTMAAAGCGMLMVVVPLALVAGWVAGQLGIPIARYWPHVLLGVLALFLLLQALPKLLYDADRGGPPSGEAT